MVFIPIDDVDDPRVQKFTQQRDALARVNGEIVVDSGRVVTRLLKQAIPVKILLASEEYYTSVASLLLQHPHTICYQASHKVLEKVIGHRLHQGVMAIADRPQDVPLTALGPRIVALNGVNNAENVGSILRSAHAFGVEGILVDPQSCSPWVRRAIRVSMGSVFKVRIHHAANLTESLQQLKMLGYRIWATGEGAKAHPPHQVSFGNQSVLVIGCEDHGVDDRIQMIADEAIRIPIAPGIDSLNASVAAGILLYAMGQS